MGLNPESQGRKELTQTGCSSLELSDTDRIQRMRNQPARWGMGSSPGKERPGSVVFWKSGKDSVTEGAWSREGGMLQEGSGQARAEQGLGLRLGCHVETVSVGWRERREDRVPSGMNEKGGIEDIRKL